MFMQNERFSESLGDEVLQEGVLTRIGEMESLVVIPEIRDENMLPIKTRNGNLISGHGEKTNEDCGTYKSLYHNSLDHVRPRRFTCHLQHCPECFRIWAKRQAASSAGYLWEFYESWTRNLGHWSLSPSERWIESFGDDTDRLWKALDKELKDVINTFSDFSDTVVAVVRHPCRKHCPQCGKALEKDSHCKECHIDGEWYWSPHLHVVTDFRYEYKRNLEYVTYEGEHQFIFTEIAQIPTKEDLEKVIAYELGHALWYENKQTQTIRYMGFSAKNHFRTEKTRVQTLVTEKDVYGNEYPFYKIQSQMWDMVENKPGVIRVKHNADGTVPYAKDIYGELIPLKETHYEYKLTPLMHKVNGRWLRIETPRKKLPKDKDTRKAWDTIGWESRFLKEKKKVEWVETPCVIYQG